LQKAQTNELEVLKWLLKKLSNFRRTHPFKTSLCYYNWYDFLLLSGYEKFCFVSRKRPFENNLVRAAGGFKGEIAKHDTDINLIEKQISKDPFYI